jgi:hypothetical protein
MAARVALFSETRAIGPKRPPRRYYSPQRLNNPSSFPFASRPDSIRESYHRCWVHHFRANVQRGFPSPLWGGVRGGGRFKGPLLSYQARRLSKPSHRDRRSKALDVLARGDGLLAHQHSCKRSLARRDFHAIRDFAIMTPTPNPSPQGGGECGQR